MTFLNKHDMLAIASIIILSMLVLHPIDSFSQSTSEGETNEIMIDVIVHKIVDGEPIVEKQQTKAILYTIPQPQLEGCERVEGIIPWSVRTQNDSKILPDLQAEIDSGKDTLCVTVVFPYVGQSYSKDPEDLSMVLGNLESISDFIMENGGTIERKQVRFTEYIHRSMTYVYASIPTSLIPELVEKDQVVVIDKYGKYPKIPSYIIHGDDSKIYFDVQEKIDSGEEIVPVDILLENIPKWPNGWPDKTSYPTKEQIAQRSEEQASEAQTMQEPVIAFLEDNNVEITGINHNLNTIHADVPVSLLSELENFDEISSIQYGIYVITSFGSNTNISEEDTREKSNKTILDITISDKTAKLEFYGNFDELKEVVIPDEITDKKLDITINEMSFDDYTLSQQQDNKTYILLNTYAEEDIVIDKPKPVKQISTSPKQQIKSGILPDEIKCKEGLSLIFKSSDTPACVKSSTAEKLIKRGWAHP